MDLCITHPSVRLTPQLCPRCDGTGKIEEENNWDQDGVTKTYNCYLCSGVGVKKKLVCQLCEEEREDKKKDSLW